MVNRTATQLVIWDWNGTLLDDAALCCDIANTCLLYTSDAADEL